jgi:hypothetical protein
LVFAQAGTTDVMAYSRARRRHIPGKLASGRLCSPRKELARFWFFHSRNVPEALLPTPRQTRHRRRIGNQLPLPGWPAKCMKQGTWANDHSPVGRLGVSSLDTRPSHPQHCDGPFLLKL